MYNRDIILTMYIFYICSTHGCSQITIPNLDHWSKPRISPSLYCTFSLMVKIHNGQKSRPQKIKMSKNN